MIKTLLLSSSQQKYLILALPVIATVISAMILSSSTIFASTDVIDQVSLTVPIACTMSGTGTTHTATLNPGTYSGASGSEYENGIGKTTLTAICNDDNGFSIYAIGYTNNEYSTTTLIGQNTNTTIPTKAYQSDDTTSNWSMKLTKITDPAESYNPQNLTIQSDAEGTFSNWHSIPSAYTKVAQYHANTGSSTTDTTLGVKLETTYATYISSSQPADTYTGQVKYTLVHPYDNTAKDGPIADCPANKICYSPNANDIEGTMGQQPINNPATTTSIVLLASNFSRKGYGFAGWSDRYDYSNDNGAKFYGPNETISFTAGQYSTTNGGLRLYAIWIPSQGSLQDQSKVAGVCNNLTTAPTDGTANLDSVSALTDQRDNDTYAIAKLADGNCWMIENLRLEAEATRGETNKNLAQGYGVSTTYGNFIGLADAESAKFSNSTAANSLYSINGANGTINIGSNNIPGYRIPRYNHANTITRATNPTDNSAAMFSYGNYYNWHAAMADTAHYTTTGEYRGTSLCPANWRLPIGNQSTTNKSYGALSVALGGPEGGAISNANSTPAGTEVSKEFRKYPNNFVYSGSIQDSSSISYRGNRGYYWSSTNNGSGGASFRLGIEASTVNPGVNTINKYNGHSVRCLIFADY